MIKTKYKLLLYRKYNVDIWGDLKNNLWRNNFISNKINKYSNKLILKFNSNWVKISIFMKKVVLYFFIKYMTKFNYKWKQSARYTFLLRNFELKDKKIKKYKNLDTFKLTLLFYVNITHRKFKYIAKKAKRLNGFFEENFLFLLEGRLNCLVYRSGLVLNMFDSIAFVKKGCIKVNGLIIKDLNYVVTIMTIIGFRSICKGFLFLNFWKKIVRKLIFMIPPKFLYFFYKFFFF